MTACRPLAAAAVALAASAAGCDGGRASDDGPAVDSTLVEALVEVHLADARAGLAPDSLGPGAADSLRAVALRAHGLDGDALERRLDALVDDPEAARAVYDAVADRLSEERRGATR